MPHLTTTPHAVVVVRLPPHGPELRHGRECYAGHRGDETPRAFTLGGRRIVVDEVTDRWLAPAHRYFKLKDAGNHTYIIRHDANTDRWELTLFQQ